jgi:hypothetical protein
MLEIDLYKESGEHNTNNQGIFAILTLKGICSAAEKSEKENTLVLGLYSLDTISYADVNEHFHKSQLRSTVMGEPIEPSPLEIKANMALKKIDEQVEKGLIVSANHIKNVPWGYYGLSRENFIDKGYLILSEHVKEELLQSLPELKPNS